MTKRKTVKATIVPNIGLSTFSDFLSISSISFKYEPNNITTETIIPLAIYISKKRLHCRTI